MAGGSNGYRAAPVSRQLTPGLISLLPETAGLPPLISFSTSYPEQHSDLSQIKTCVILASKVARSFPMQA
jgi:hypothetical protein